MNVDDGKLVTELANIVSMSQNRAAALQKVADKIKSYGNYRWVGLYDVDHTAGVVRNIVWSGPNAPEYPTFPVTKGLTGAAIAERKAVNVGDVSADPRYLTALPTTRSEIIVPVFDRAGRNVVGTIDVESEHAHAFSQDAQSLLQACSQAIGPLWNH